MHGEAGLPGIPARAAERRSEGARDVPPHDGLGPLHRAALADDPKCLAPLARGPLGPPRTDGRAWPLLGLDPGDVRADRAEQLKKKNDICRNDMRFREVPFVEYAKTNPLETTIALGATGAVGLGVATSLKEILHDRYISYLLPLTKEPEDFDLSIMQEATREYLRGDNVRFTAVTVAKTKNRYESEWYAKFRVEVKGLAAARDAQRSIEKCLEGAAEPVPSPNAPPNASPPKPPAPPPLFGTATHLFKPLQPGRIAFQVQHGHGIIQDRSFNHDVRVHCQKVLNTLNTIVSKGYKLSVPTKGFIIW